jgi:hypothetical protein
MQLLSFVPMIFIFGVMFVSETAATKNGFCYDCFNELFRTDDEDKKLAIPSRY